MISPRDIVEKWAANAMADPSSVAHIGSSIRFEVAGNGGGSWVFDCRGPFRLHEERDEADCTIGVSVHDFLSIGAGELNPQAAYLEGKLKVSGDAFQALKISALMGKTC